MEKMDSAARHALLYLQTVSKENNGIVGKISASELARETAMCWRTAAKALQTLEKRGDIKYLPVGKMRILVVTTWH